MATTATTATKCNHHAVGTAERNCGDYPIEILRADNDGSDVCRSSFEAFSFCPYCGIDVQREAETVEKRIQKKWDEVDASFRSRHS